LVTSPTKLDELMDILYVLSTQESMYCVAARMPPGSPRKWAICGWDMSPAVLRCKVYVDSSVS